MNPLQRALIEKTGYDNGFEYVRPVEHNSVVLASARHPAQVRVTMSVPGFEVSITSGSATLAQELARTFAGEAVAEQMFFLPTEATLARWLRRAAALSQALPNQAVALFEQRVQAELLILAPSGTQNTDVLRMVRQRVGQQAYRQAMLGYWGGACAVTGLALPQALRASHARPWVECDTDAQRLDVYNGFLLSANLDALFDNFLISFSDAGQMLVSKKIPPVDRACLGLDASLRLRWMAEQHVPYLVFHRRRFAVQDDLQMDEAGVVSISL